MAPGGALASDPTHVRETPPLFRPALAITGAASPLLPPATSSVVWNLLGMKRRHELTVDGPLGGGLLPGDSSLENLPRHSLKKRRVVDHDDWKGLGRRKSLRDINNLSSVLDYDLTTT